MKKFIIILACLVSFGFSVNAQAQKFGHINTNELIALMSERDSALVRLQAYNNELVETMQGMEDEYNAKYTEYNRKQAEWTNAVRETKEREIQELIQRINQFQQTAQQEMNEMQQTLMNPVLEKAQAAIEKVAKANSLTYVFDLAAGSLIYFDEQTSLNLLPLAKKELGIPEAKVAPSQLGE